MAYKQHIVKSKLTCPKCKSKDLLITENWVGHYIVWEQINGEFDREDGSLEPGNPDHLTAKCKNKNCKHLWRIKKKGQIDSIVID